MEQLQFDTQYKQYQTAVEAFLSDLFTEKADYDDLYASMRYSMLAGGKRLRPVLTLEFARLAGLDWRLALPMACALELVHTYSLIHDDLPCMDDDDFRRGKPTNHKVFGETLAVLAGDALQPEAFRLILTVANLSAERRADCALVLANAIGAAGMVGGQVLDTLHTPKTASALTQVHRLKTGALIAGAAQMGCAAVGEDPVLRSAAAAYAQHLGMAFQIRDDLLDVIGNAATFGKPTGSDAQEGKITFVDLLGQEGCTAAIREHTDAAKAALADLGDSDFLCYLAEQLATRDR